MATTDIVIRGAREHNLRDVSLDLPRGALICFTGVSGLGQELARLRHALCRGATALRREPLQLRPPVPRPDAQARGRPDRRPEPLDLDPAEDRRAQPPEHRRHDHRDQRLPPRAVRPGRPGALPELRPAGRGADPRADRRADPRPARRHRLQPARPGRSAARRGNTRTSSPSSAAPATCGRGSMARSSP